MEPRGCNQWLLVANRPGLKTAKASQNRCRGLRPVCEAREGRVGRGARGDSHQIRPGVALCWSAGRTRSACTPNRFTSLELRIRAWR